MESFMMMCMVCAFPSVLSSPDYNQGAIAKRIEHSARATMFDFVVSYCASSSKYFHTIGYGNIPRAVCKEEYIDIHFAIAYFTDNLQLNKGNPADNYMLRSLAHAL